MDATELKAELLRLIAEDVDIRSQLREAIEEEGDVRAARIALDEPGAPIPYAQLQAEMAAERARELRQDLLALLRDDAEILDTLRRISGPPGAPPARQVTQAVSTRTVTSRAVPPWLQR